MSAHSSLQRPPDEVTEVDLSLKFPQKSACIICCEIDRAHAFRTLFNSWPIYTYLSFPWNCGWKNIEQRSTILHWSPFRLVLSGNLPFRMEKVSLILSC